MRKRDNPSANRNKEPILEVLRSILDNETENLDLLEISSGTGQHLAFFAKEFPNIRFQPSEYDRTLFSSITAYAEESPDKNIKEPVFIDIATRYTEWEPTFNPDSYDYMLNINMLHISPWDCAQGLFKNAGKLLKRKGLLITYGPYAVNGVLEPASNVNFNMMLSSQNSDWGVRDTRDLKELATQNGLVFRAETQMPANNKTLIWQKE